MEYQEKTTSDIVNDMKVLYTKYGFFEEKFDLDKLKFRHSLLKEEYEEITKALENQDPEELVDGLIDIIVIAVGTLLLAGVDVDKAWVEVFKSNMMKERGVKPGREASGGFDLIKPLSWRPPFHRGNRGVLDGIFKS